ncbi:MAG TPA: hypothetical protein VFA03_05435 [Acetobacteraceae bacterium]|nr:hypothetical protein [Acetobacteraceae bacterium]
MSDANALTVRQREDLRALAATMIPASAEYGVPGADDPAIQAEILGCCGGREAPLVRTALDQLAALAGGSFASLDPVSREAVAMELRATGGAPAAALIRVVLQCYYRDERVVRSLGREPRPPFPQGHTLEPGDWSLLDAVRARAPSWRPSS